MRIKKDGTRFIQDLSIQHMPTRSPELVDQQHQLWLSTNVNTPLWCLSTLLERGKLPPAIVSDLQIAMQYIERAKKSMMSSLK